MKLIVTRKNFRMEIAHKLNLPYESKCCSLHGHSIRLDVSVQGEPNEHGIVIDFKLLKDIVNNSVVEGVDHTYLNDYMEINPTAENLLMIIAANLKQHFDKVGVKLYKLALYETENN